jgi:hypothetical protein
LALGGRAIIQLLGGSASSTPGRDPGYNLTAALAAYQREAAEINATLLLSSEDFSVARPSREFVERLAPITAVCYFRHPAEWVESSFRWLASHQTNRFQSIEQFVETGGIKGWLDYEAKAEAWSLPGVTLVPRLYSRDTVGDFLLFVGARGIEAARGNDSIRNLTAKLATDLGRYGPVSAKVVRHLDQQVREAAPDDGQLLSKELYDRLMDLVTPQIARFIDRFMPTDGAALLERRWRQPILSKVDEQRLTKRFMASYHSIAGQSRAD